MSENRASRLKVAGILAAANNPTDEESDFIGSLKMKDDKQSLHVSLIEVAKELRLLKKEVNLLGKNNAFFSKVSGVLGVVASTLDQLANKPDVPLLPLSPFHHFRNSEPDQCPLTTRASDFFSWELEKGMAGSLEPKLVALPLYLDFGMFCVNAKVFDLVHITSFNKDDIESRRIDSLDENDKGTACGKTKKKTIGSVIEEKEWKIMVEKIPRYWVAIRDEWFIPPDSTKYLSLIHI